MLKPQARSEESKRRLRSGMRICADAGGRLPDLVPARAVVLAALGHEGVVTRAGGVDGEHVAGASVEEGVEDEANVILAVESGVARLGVADDAVGPFVVAEDADDDLALAGEHLHARGEGRPPLLVRLDHRQVGDRLGFRPGGLVEAAVQAQVRRQSAGLQPRAPGGVGGGFGALRAARAGDERAGAHVVGMWAERHAVGGGDEGEVRHQQRGDEPSVETAAGMHDVAHRQAVPAHERLSCRERRTRLSCGPGHGRASGDPAGQGRRRPGCRRLVGTAKRVCGAPLGGLNGPRARGPRRRRRLRRSFAPSGSRACRPAPARSACA